MEGVKRITIFVNQEKICRIRAPYLFKDLIKVLQSHNLNFNEKIDVSYQKRKEKITNHTSYQMALDKCGFEGLTINLTKPLNNSTKSIKKSLNLPKKRPSLSSKSPKPTKKSSPDPSNSISTPKSSPSKSRSLSPSLNRSSSSQSSPSRSKSGQPSSKPSKTQSPSKPSKPSKTQSKPLPSPVKASPKSPKIPSRQTPDSKKVQSSKSLTTPSKPSKDSSSSFSIPSKSPSSLSKPISKPLRSSPSPSNPSQISSPSLSCKNQMGSLSLFQSDQQEVEILNSFGYIPDEGQLKVLSEDGLKSRTLHEFSIKRSSRLLLTPEGIMITGGSGAPYQVYMVKKDYSLVPLVSMNHPRFWHSMGFIDGHPAVINGAERSKIPKLFLSSVEVYKDGAWVDYPNTNCPRASCSVTFNDGQVFIVGGVKTDGNVNSVVNIIEKWENGNWVVLDMKLRSCLISPGCFNFSDQKILIFGGEITGGSYKIECYEIDLNSQGIRECKSLMKGSKFTYGQQSRIYNGELKVCDCFGNIMKIEI